MTNACLFRRAAVERQGAMAVSDLALVGKLAKPPDSKPGVCECKSHREHQRCSQPTNGFSMRRGKLNPWWSQDCGCPEHFLEALREFKPCNVIISGDYVVPKRELRRQLKRKYSKHKVP